MAYITYEQYIDLYRSCPIQEADFPVYAGIASDLIDSITQYRLIQGGGIAALPEWAQTLVQKAAAAQVLYFTQLGLETVLTGQAGQSFTVGKVSVSGGSLANANAAAGQLTISPTAKVLLEQTGLMYRGVSVYSDRFLNPFWGI
nr:MAG TPA: Head Tail Connector Protein [Caudoviricetes sp.]